jgi:hypothetical protein
MREHRGPNDNPQEEIVESLQQLDATQAALLDTVGGTLSQDQKDTLADLLRLDASLDGPDDTLDQELYSRPFPPAPPSSTPQFKRIRRHETE